MMKILYLRTVFIACVLVVPLTNVEGQRCNGGAECIALQSCSGLYTQLRNGATPQLTQLLRSLHCGFENFDNPKVCCPPEFLYQPITNPTTQALRTVDPTSLLPTGKVCGIQNNDRIVGGTETEIDEHPWMALLRYEKPNGWGFYCGGVLISPRYILTAAHCVGGDLPANWRLSQVRLGEWNTASSADCVQGDCTGPVQDVPVEEIIPHEGYDTEDTNQLNDIALLRLSRNVQYTDFVKPICLPLTNELKQSKFERFDMEVAGWGKTENRSDDNSGLDPASNGFKLSGSESNVKLKATVPVVSNEQCATVFAKVGREIRDTQICAGGAAGRDSCRGDSGGALMGQARTANNWLALGVVSYGPSPCGTEGWPGVYTRVGAYVDWILSKIRS